MKAIFKPAAAALLCLATEAYGTRLAVQNRLATPANVVANEVHITMPDLSTGSCTSQNNPSYSQVVGDLKRIFNQHASLTDKLGRPAMTEQEWIDFVKEKGLLQTTLQWNEEDNWGWSEEDRIKFIFKHTTAERNDQWLPFTFEQFMSGISMIGEYRRMDKYSGNPEEMKNRNTFDELVAWITNRDALKVTHVNFKHIQKFGARGGSAGQHTVSTTIRTGRSSSHEVSHAAMAAVTASLEYSNSLSPVSGDVTLSGQYDFSSVTSDSSNYEKTSTETLTIDLSKPVYVYEKVVTIYYANGETDRIGSGMLISDVPLPLNQTFDTCDVNN